MNPVVEAQACLERANEWLEVVAKSHRFPYMVVTDSYDACYQAAIGVLSIARDDTFKAPRIRKRFAELVTGSPYFPTNLVWVLEDLAQQSIRLEDDLRLAKAVTTEDAAEAEHKAVRFVRAAEAWIKTHPNYQVAA